MDWVKANTSIVASAAVIVVALPAAWFGSSLWNGKIKAAREQAVDKASRDLDALKVSYTVAAPFPSGPSLTMPMDAANPAVTKVFKEAREKLDGQIGEVSKIAEGINKGDHKPLVDGMFPNPADKQLSPLAFMEALVGKGDKPSAYRDLLKSINAGGPADAASLAEQLTEERKLALESFQAEHNSTKLGADDEAALAKKLAGYRLAAYKRHARTISVYATEDFFPQAPKVIPPEPPDAAACFKYQFDYWVVADLLKAIDAANRPDGKGGGVEASVVKRIERITLDPPDFPEPGQTASFTGAPATGSAAPAGSTLTGRKGGGANGAYDL